ncbi:MULTISPECIES: DUF1616 domain-containing protein [Halorussus]|uniref:DUF1616 domain-containing protein n=1 Tax=Halorussus TaxID=1070314 RepID=UPI0020A090F6|nr:DUF1616 domain-containing protein [Halorussus vallis]USZ76305.1 DUF1616 domain-containing protein [Halorussus vallis]
MSRVPRDLVAVVALTALAGVAVLGTQPGSVLTTPSGASPVAVAGRLAVLALGLAFLLFLPGYAVVSALFPNDEPAVESVDEEGEPIAPRFRFRDRKGVDTLERVTLAFGVSAIVTPMLALVLNFTPFGVRAAPLVAAVGGFTVVAAVVAAVRRLRLPADERFDPSLRPAASPLLGRSGDHRLATVALVLGVLVAAVGVGYAVTVPKPGAQFTELYVLSQNQNGTYVADDYPALSASEPTPFVVGFENRESRPTDYVGVVELQRVDGNRVVEQRRVKRFSATLEPGGNERVRVRVPPTNASTENLRLRVLLYRGSLPENPNAASAYRMTELQFGGANATTSGTTTASSSNGTAPNVTATNSSG